MQENLRNDEYALRIAAANKRKNPDPGERSYTEQPVDAIANGIGMVHQHFKLVPSLTVYENILLGAEITQKKGGMKLRLSIRKRKLKELRN